MRIATREALRMKEFTRPAKVRFSDVDYAGIIFYPRHFEMLNATVEDWFEKALGVDFRALHEDYSLSSPLVNVETTFHAPCRLGETLLLRLRVARLSDRSVTLNVDTTFEDELRIQTRCTHVCTRKGLVGPAHWPTEMKTNMEQYLETGVSNE